MTATDPVRAGRREWTALGALVLPTLIISMDLVVLILATPALSEALHPSGTQLLWITDVYGFLIAGSLVTMGTLGDRIGRRRLLLAGATAFGLASLLAAFAPTAELLILARALLGIAGATLMPSTLALLRNLFVDEAQRRFAIGLWVTSFSAGTVVGPLVAGVLLQHFWWGSVFLLNLPVMVALLIVGPRLLPEVRDPAPGPFDLPGAALSVLALLALIYGVKRVAEAGADPTALAALLVGAAVGVVFVRRQRRIAHPLLDVGLFRSVPFRTSAMINILIGVVLAGIFLFVAQYLQLVLGMSPLEAGLWTIPPTAGIIAGSLLAPVLVRRIPAPRVVSGGLAVAAVGLLVLAQVGSEPDLALVVTGLTVLGIGAAPASTLSVDLIIGSAPPERAGAASAVSETGNELGNALGIALLGSVGVAVYRGAMGGGLPVQLSSEEAAAAADTLAGAYDAAAGLPAAAGAELMAVATEAFVAGMQLAAWVGAALALAAALAAPALLRRASH
ncbi:MFS transporter [Pseudonocardia sp. DSM 110487]|nr:MFS transporter [Pseudonocardia sp. DSM 110487]QYN32179.1 MFS transporter [Pseudonocardia sp. DSM 110487]